MKVVVQFSINSILCFDYSAMKILTQVPDGLFRCRGLNFWNHFVEYCLYSNSYIIDPLENDLSGYQKRGKNLWAGNGSRPSMIVLPSP